MRKIETSIHIIVQAKGLLCQESLNFSELQTKCRLEFEQRNNSPGFGQKPSKNVGILYNKCSMARGIFFDGKRMEKGEVRLGLFLPTTEAEICDFIRVVAEIKLQYRNIQLTNNDANIGMEEFVQGKENYFHYSLATLREICSKNEATLELIHAPYTLTPKEQHFFSSKGSLHDLQLLLHRRQTEQKNDVGMEIQVDSRGKTSAVFSIICNYPTVMPISYLDSVYLEGQTVDDAEISMYASPGDLLLEKNFSYKAFIDLLLEFGADKKDEKHISLPAFTEEELLEIASELQG